MPAVILNIELDEARDNTFNLRWLDKDDDPIDLTGYGAIAELRSKEGELISRITHADNISIQTPDPGGVDFAADGGKYSITFPAVDLTKPVSREGDYEVVLFPNSAQPTTQPSANIRGSVVIRKAVVSLDE